MPHARDPRRQRFLTQAYGLPFHHGPHPARVARFVQGLRAFSESGAGFRVRRPRSTVLATVAVARGGFPQDVHSPVVEVVAARFARRRSATWVAESSFTP